MFGPKRRGDKYMPFGFDRRKSIQAVAFFLKTRPDATDNYMRLLKVLYIADRESLQETGTPITGDRFASMEHGTMLSRLLDLAKGKQSTIVQKDDTREWSTYISREAGYSICMKRDPGEGALCEYEIDKLREVAERYKSCTQWDMRRITHELPEYEDVGKHSRLIPVRQFFNAVGMGDVADQIVEDAEACASLDRMLGR